MESFLGKVEISAFTRDIETYPLGCFTKKFPKNESIPPQLRESSKKKSEKKAGRQDKVDKLARIVGGGNSGNARFLASQDAQEVMLVSQ